MSQLADNWPTEYFDKGGPQLSANQDESEGDRRLEQKDCRIQLEHNRGPYQEEMKTFQTGRIDTERNLRKWKAEMIDMMS